MAEKKIKHCQSPLMKDMLWTENFGSTIFHEISSAHRLSKNGINYNSYFRSVFAIFPPQLTADN